MSVPNALRLILAASVLGALCAPTAALAAVQKPSPYPSAAAGTPVELIEDLEGAKVNWSSGQLTVSGTGVPGDRGPMIFKKALANRAALADAYRRLAASLGVVRVDGNSRVQDLAVGDDALRSRLNDFVKNARVLETNYWPDGTAEVVLGVSVTGDRSLTSLLAGEATPASPAPSPAASPSASPEMQVVSSPLPLRAQYSSVIIDARGIGATPALLPTFRDDAGKPLAWGEQKPSVKYLKGNPDLAPAAGLNPLVVKARRPMGLLKSDLVLGPEGSQALKDALKDQKLAPNARVLVQL